MTTYLCFSADQGETEDDAEAVEAWDARAAAERCHEIGFGDRWDYLDSLDVVVIGPDGERSEWTSKVEMEPAFHATLTPKKHFRCWSRDLGEEHVEEIEEATPGDAATAYVRKAAPWGDDGEVDIDTLPMRVAVEAPGGAVSWWSVEYVSWWSVEYEMPVVLVANEARAPEGGER